MASDPNDADGYIALAGALSFAGRPAEALDAVERAMRLNPHYPSSYAYQRGLALFGLNRLDEAAASLERAIEINRDDYWSQRLLLAVYGLAGKARRRVAARADDQKQRPARTLGRARPVDDPRRHLLVSVRQAGGCEALRRRARQGGHLRLEAQRFAGLHVEHLDRRIAERRLEFGRRAIDHGERAVVHRDHLLRTDEFAQGVSSAFRVHREMAADADESEIRFVEATDERHVAEHVGVAGVVDLEAVLELDDVADRRSRLRRTACRSSPASTPSCPSSPCVARAPCATLMPGPSGETVPPMFIPTGVFAASSTPADTGSWRARSSRSTVAPGQARELLQVDEVVTMPVGDEDQVDLAERGEVLVLRRRPRIGLEEGIDDDHLARRAREAESRVAEPEDLDLLGHAGARENPAHDCDQRRPATGDRQGFLRRIGVVPSGPADHTSASKH